MTVNTELQIAFVVEYVANGGNATKAAVEAGYSQASARQIASQLLGKPHMQQAIQKEQQRKLNGLGSKALQVIESILNDDNSPAGVRLDAAKTVLDRCGLSAQVNKLPLPGYEKPLEEMTIDELNAFIIEGQKQLGEMKTVEGELVN